MYNIDIDKLNKTKWMKAKKKKKELESRQGISLFVSYEYYLSNDMI